MNEPHDMLATAFETDGSGCEHREPTCSDCLADTAVRVLKDYLLDELADDDRFQQWYRANVEALDEIDEDMTYAAIVAHYLTEVILPSGRPVETVELPEAIDGKP